MEAIVKNQEETKILAEVFADNIKEKGGFISLFGDIGAGKTAFCRYAIKHLGVKEDVTSPSFVILNEYKGLLPVYHFDLYRLEDAGVESIKDELREYSKENVLTFVEWADFGKDELPFEKMEINVEYDYDNYSTERKFKFKGTNKYYEDVIKKTIEDFKQRVLN